MELLDSVTLELNSLRTIYDKLYMQYKDTLNGGLKKMLEVAVSISDSESKKLQCEAIMETFNLTEKELKNYLLVVKIEKMYNNFSRDLSDIVEIILEDDSLFREFSSEIVSIQSGIKAINLVAKKLLDESEKKSADFNGKEDYLSYELGSNSNFILYLDNVEMERKRTVHSKSGMGIDSMASVCKEIEMLTKSDYDVLRSKGKIHQLNDGNNNGMHITSSNVAYERFGSTTTKLGYIRIPVDRNNLELLRRKYNNSILKYVVIIISFGNFLNDGLSETKLYDHFKFEAKQCIDELEDVIKIFKEPFTPDSLEKACYMIENGISITNSLSTDPLKPISCNDKGRM